MQGTNSLTGTDYFTYVSERFDRNVIVEYPEKIENLSSWLEQQVVKEAIEACEVCYNWMNCSGRDRGMFLYSEIMKDRPAKKTMADLHKLYGGDTAADAVVEALRSTKAASPPDKGNPGIEILETGAKRGTELSDCMLCLIPPEALYAWGRAFGEGAKKYGLHNWLKGFPFTNLMTHAQMHLLQYTSGDRSEDHLGHALWNIGAMIHFSVHRPELNDLPPYKQASATGE